MKVLFATPYKSSTGGISQWAGHIINYYNVKGKADCELEVLPMNDVKQGRSKIGISLRQRIVYGIQTYSNVLAELSKKLRTEKYDILHISTSASISLIKDLLMIRTARRHNVKTIVHFHFGRIPTLVKQNNWEWKLLNRVIRKADVAIVMDLASYNALKEKGVKNVRLVPNPLASSVEEYVKQNSGVVREERTVTFVGHVVKTKGVFELVEACKEIPNVKLNIVGPVQDNVKAALLDAAQGREWLNLVGTLPMESVLNEMLSCSVFALPTYTEGFPNVILESMACGCPIVTTPVGAIPEMLQIDGATPCGICVEPTSVGQLKDAISYMLSNKAKASEFGLLARERVVKEYTINVVWPKLVEIWCQCVTD